MTSVIGLVERSLSNFCKYTSKGEQEVPALVLHAVLIESVFMFGKVHPCFKSNLTSGIAYIMTSFFSEPDDLALNDSEESIFLSFKSDID